MDNEDQDPENVMETHYKQEFEMLKGMFADHFSEDLIAGVLEDCDGDVNLAVDTLTKIEGCTDAATNQQGENMTTNANTSSVANSNIETFQTIVAMDTPSYANVSLNTVKPPLASLPVKNTPNPVHTKLRIDYWSDQLRKVVADYHEGYRVLIIMRGAPGSGKTYLARAIVDHTVGTASSNNLLNFIFSADDLFINNGKYQYDVTRLDEVHTKNRKRVQMALTQGRSPVIVDNTNMTSWEMQPYVQLGVRYGYIIEIIEPSTPWATNAAQLAKKNSHGVPKDKIQRMLEKYEGKYTGKSIMKYFNMSYPRDKIPPVRRNIPPFPLYTAQEMAPPRALPIFIEPRNCSESPPKQEHKVYNSAVVKPESDITPTQSIAIDNQSSSNENATFETNEPSNVEDQMQQKVHEVQKHFEEICKVEEEWEKGDSWEPPASNEGTRMESSELKPKPQRAKTSNEDIPSDKMIEPAMVCDDWTRISMFMPPWHDNKTAAIEEISQIQVKLKTSATWVERDDFIDGKYKTIIAKPRHISNFFENTKDVPEKIPNQRMLDKSTTTYEASVNGIYRCTKEDKHFISLKKMFRNISRPVLRDIFDQCCGDVNWASSIVLEGMENKSLQISNNEDSDTEEEEELDFCECWATYNIIPDKTTEPISPLPLETPSQVSTPVFKKKTKKDKILSDGTIQLKRQIEKTVTISENHYSPNHLMLMKLRRDGYSPNTAAKDTITDNQNTDTTKPHIEANDQAIALLNISEGAVQSNSQRYQSGTPNSHSNDPYNNPEPSTSGIKNNQEDEYLLDDLCDEDSDDDKSVTSGDTEMVSVNLGMDFVKRMDEVFGREEFEYPEGVKPEVTIPLSLLQVINAYWVEAIACQLDNYQKQTEEMIRQDEEFARQVMQAEADAVAQEMTENNEEDNAPAPKSEPHQPSFKEIMDADLALALYEKEVKEEWKNKEPQDLAAKMTREKLFNLFPDVAKETLSEMLIAHDNSFEATVESLLVSTGQAQYLQQDNGINKFVIEKETEIRDKMLEEQRRELDEDFPSLYTKIGEEKPTVTMESVNKIRDKAEHHRLSRDVYQRRAQFYVDRKLWSTATYYSQIASMQTRKFEHANHYAAATLIYFHSSMRPEANIIDLHYLRVAEAYNALDLYLDERLAYLRRTGGKTLVVHVITGRGKHSNGRARVKPAVMRRLHERKVEFRQQNPGLLEARLTPGHLLTDELNRS